MKQDQSREVMLYMARKKVYNMQMETTGRSIQVKIADKLTIADNMRFEDGK